MMVRPDRALTPWARQPQPVRHARLPAPAQPHPQGASRAMDRQV